MESFKQAPEDREDGMTQWGRVRERRGTEPLCVMAVLSLRMSGIGPCEGAARWRLTFDSGKRQCHSCDGHLAEVIRERGAGIELTELPEPSLRAPIIESPNAPPPIDRSPITPEDRADRQKERPGAYSHVHIPRREEHLGVTGGDESGARRHYPDGATPNPDGLEREHAGPPGRPE